MCAVIPALWLFALVNICYSAFPMIPSTFPISDLDSSIKCKGASVYVLICKMHTTRCSDSESDAIYVPLINVFNNTPCNSETITMEHQLAGIVWLFSTFVVTWLQPSGANCFLIASQFHRYETFLFDI